MNIFRCTAFSVFMFSAAVSAQAQQVTFSANVVQIVLNDEHREGVDWEAIVSDFHTLQLKKEDNPIWLDKKYKINVGTVSVEDYAVLLEALDTVGQVSQYPQASLTLEPEGKGSLNVVLGEGKEPANIRLEEEMSTVRGENVLRLEPFIGFILKESGKPVAVTLKAQTDVVLKDNATIVIGGITSEQEITKTHKFPLLGDLPFLGLVFRSQGRLMQKMETVIFLTSHMNAVAAPEEKP